MVCLMLGDFRGLCKYGASVISFLLEFQICSYIGLSWVLSPFSTFYLGPWSCCGGAGKAWTLTSWTQSWIQPLPLAHCANVSQSHGCCLLSTICVRDSRPPHIRQSAQPPCPVTDGQTESTHTHLVLMALGWWNWLWIQGFLMVFFRERGSAGEGFL